MVHDPTILALLMAAAALAGFVDAIAGGGGLITVPALLLAGVSPIEAIATNKVQGTCGVAMSSLAFARRGHADIRGLASAIVATAIGAMTGSLLVGLIDQRWLAGATPFLLLFAALYFAVLPLAGTGERVARLRPLAFALFVAAPIGFYDGVFGPGAGSMFMLGLVSLRSMEFLPATAATKILNLTSNVAALTVFMAGGHVLWLIGLAMAVAQIVGSWIGSHAAMRFGPKLIRGVLVPVTLAVAVKLLYDPANPVGNWLRGLH